MTKGCEIFLDTSILVKAGFDFVLSVFALVLLKRYLEIFFQYSGKKVQAAVCGGVFLAWQILTTGLLDPPAMLNIIINIMLSILVSITAFNGSLWKKMIFSISYHAIWMLMEIFCSYLITLVPFNEILSRSLGAAMSEGALFLIIIALKRVFAENNIQELSANYTAVLMLVPIGSIFVVDNTFRLSCSIGTRSEKIWSAAAFLIMLGINIVIFNIYIRLADEFELRRCMTAYEQQLELCERHQKERELSMLQVRNLRHNMKNDLISILALARQRECSKIEEFAEELLQDVAVGKREVANSGNIIVDSLINYRYSQAKSKEIDFTVEMKIPMQLPFKGADLCLILGNALENAEEAAGKMPSGKRFIDIHLTYDKGNLLILVRNSHDGYFKKDKFGQFKTIKDDAINHGIGLQSIFKAVEKYHGAVIINSQEEIFGLKILLYQMKESFT